MAPPVAHADDEPYLAIRTGFRCSKCHTNVTGGGKRTTFGAMFAQARLPMTVARIGDGPYLYPQVGDFLALGANFRLQSSREFQGENPRNPIDITQATFFAEFRIVPDRLAIYIDENVAPGTPRNREAFLLLDGLPGRSYVKAGRFFLPYGFRLLDDGEFIRLRTGFNYSVSDHGVELGLEPGPLSLSVAVTNGTQGAAEENSSKQVTGLAALVFNQFRVGASASHNQGADARRDVYGAFGGFRLGRFAFLGEVDFINDDPPDGRRGDEIAAFLEANLLVARGWNLKMTYGFLDPDRDIGENARVRVRFGVEPFITQFLQASVFYTLNQDIPQSTADRDQLVFELHGFF